MRNKSLIFLMILGAFIFLVSPVYAQDDSQQTKRDVVDLKRIEELKVIQARNEESIMGIPGVVGIGIGLTEDGENLAFIIYVEKLNSTIKAHVPDRIENVPVRLIESGKFRAY